jgi:nitronate monooxygenase
MLAKLGMRLPIIQAPMAGVSSPAMAAAVSLAGGLGSIGVGATDAAGARAMIAEVRERSTGALNVNLFCHAPATARHAVEEAWIERLRPEFYALGAKPPARLTEIYQSFVGNDAMLHMLLAEKPSCVSFHFGVPDVAVIHTLRAAGITLLACATCPAEAHKAASAGVDGVIAQGWEAGGHRGVFDPEASDDRLGTMALVRLLAGGLPVPVIAAGGIMDGAGIAAALRLGASAAQLGTAFIDTDESLADDGYRATLASDAAYHTTMTRVISGRPARCLANRFTALGEGVAEGDVPAYPIAYDLGKALHAAGRAQGEVGYGAQWAGQGAPLVRKMPAGRLVAVLSGEIA